MCVFQKKDPQKAEVVDVNKRSSPRKNQCVDARKMKSSRQHNVWVLAKGRPQEDRMCGL